MTAVIVALAHIMTNRRLAGAVPLLFEFVSGSLIGPYEVIAPLGAGGMGVVYRCRDSRLGREVAVKVLHADVVSDPERRRRFETEARAASALNHPNILTVYDIGEHEGVPYIVSELVDGENVREAIRRDDLHGRRILEIAVQIADGLAAAHQAGIVHRDLKPENTMLTRQDRVKIVDFGLARLEPMASLPHAETMTVGETGAGVVMGTVNYMSPEQARGAQVDHRSDQFSFGSMLYEMAARRRPFERPSGVETLAAIIGDEPDPIDRLNARIPAPLCWVIERCLSKDPRQRYHATADLYQELRILHNRFAELATGTSRSTAAVRPRRRWWMAALPLAGMAAAFVAGAWIEERPVPAPVFRPLATEALIELEPQWSPDGKSIVYLRDVDGVLQVFTRSLDSLSPAQITRSPVNCMVPAWSADGTRVYFRADTTLWSVAAAGGAPQKVLDGVAQFAASPDGRVIAFTKSDAGSGIFIYALTDGSTRPYRGGPAGQSPQRQIRFSPDGRSIGALWPVQREHAIQRAFWILPFPEIGTPRQITLDASSFAWLPDGKRLVAARQPAGEFSPHLYLVDTRDGSSRRLTAGASAESDVAVSPDGRRIAFTAGETDTDLVEILVDGGPSRTLLGTSRSEDRASWSPDGSQFAYVQNASGAGDEIWLRSATGGWSKPLFSSPVSTAEPIAFTSPAIAPDGQRIVYERWANDGHLVWVANIAGGPPLRLVNDNNHQHAPAWSPDGNWIAYRANRGDKRYLEKVPSGGGNPVRLAEVSTASEIEWSPAGDWIAYMAVATIHILRPDGSTHRSLVEHRGSAFGFAKDGAWLYALVREGAAWKLRTYDVPTGARRDVVTVDLPALAQPVGFTLHPDGQRFTTAVGSSRRDVWMMEGRW